MNSAPAQKKQVSKSNASKFFKNVKNFLREVQSPKCNELKETMRIHFLGLFLIGLFGYIIKVIHIPINNIIVGSEK